jgi:hypothetical protein
MAQACPTCGMDSQKWSQEGQGFKKDDQQYCCSDCANGQGCNC